MNSKKDWSKFNFKGNNTQNGEDIELTNKYVLWVHEITCKDWSLQGYTKICSIENVSQFWKLFNNINKLGYKINNFFLMKEGIDPTWEHEKNRDGGTCSLKIEMTDALNVYEEMCSYMVCDIITDLPDDINGISFSPKNNWGIIKIWNSDKKNDLSTTMHSDIINKYQVKGLRYVENQPEF